MMPALSADKIARFDRLFEQDEKCRLRAAYNRRLADALAASSADSSALPSWLSRPQEIAWHIEEGRIDPPELALEISAEDRRFAFSAEGAFLARAKARTGETMPPDKLERNRRRARELLDQSHEIARKMGAAGFDCYRNTPFSVFRHYVHSGHTEKLPGFRRVTFIPYVAQSIRAPMLAALESWNERHPFARMWVFTTGRRTPLCDVRERAKFLHGKLSDLNAADFMREAGVEIVFRATELGTPELTEAGAAAGGEIETDEDGQIYFHVHAHCIVHQKFGYIAPDKWDALLERVGKFWGFWWKESGRIVEPREVCKYVTKPGEMMKLDGAQLVALQQQLSRLKLIQPMGSLAAEIKARAEKGLRLYRDRTPEGIVLREDKNHNRHQRRTRDQKSQDAAEKLRKASAADVCRVVSRGMPSIGPAGVSEPTVTVLANRWDAARVRCNPLVAGLIEATAAEWRRGSALASTYAHQLLGETRPFPFVADLPPPQIPLSAAELAGYTR